MTHAILLTWVMRVKSHEVFPSQGPYHLPTVRELLGICSPNPNCCDCLLAQELEKVTDHQHQQYLNSLVKRHNT